VAEYWVVDPVVRCLRQFSANTGKFGTGLEHRAPARLESTAFSGLLIDLGSVFEGMTAEALTDRLPDYGAV